MTGSVATKKKSVYGKKKTGCYVEASEGIFAIPFRCLVSIESYVNLVVNKERN